MTKETAGIQIAKNQLKALNSIKGTVNSNSQAIAKGLKEVRQLGQNGEIAKACDKFNSLTKKFPVAGKYHFCKPCDTSTPHEGRECLLCGTWG